MSKLESLPEYVRRIMKEKDLRAKEVQRRSGDKIDDAYVIKIMKGITTNPSISKTQALAEGLGVDEDELFKVARGIPINESGSRGGDPWPSNVLIKTMESITSSPELTRAVKTIVAMKPAKLKALLKQLEKE
jgi:transcriptional regulator with XRE-family HTH domain